MGEKTFLLYKSCRSQELLTEGTACDILKENKMNARDLKLVKRYLETETIIERPLILARPSCHSIVFFMEHIKVRY